MKKMMMNGLVLALLVGNAFSSAPASSSSSGPTLGSFAFKNRSEAKRHGVSFDQNNKFVMRELVVIHNPVHNGGVLVYGIIVGRNQGVWDVKEKYEIDHAYNTDEIGKLPQVADSQAAASSSSAEAPIRNFTKEDLGGALNDILGKTAFKDMEHAKRHGVSFDNNNTFAKRELVVVQDPRNWAIGADYPGPIYGVVLGRTGQPNKWYIQANKSDSNYLAQIEFADSIGKMLIESMPIQQAPLQAAASSSSVARPAHGQPRPVAQQARPASSWASRLISTPPSQAASMAPGGLAIEQEPGEQEEEENKEAEGVPSKKR